MFRLDHKIAIITGAASGIGKACVDLLVQEGCSVVALDINAAITGMFKSTSVLGLTCDVTNSNQLDDALRQTITRFGGLDYLVLNAGIFPKSMSIKDMDGPTWDKCLNINLTSQQQLLQKSIPFLELGIEPAVVIVGSKCSGTGAGSLSLFCSQSRPYTVGSRSCYGARSKRNTGQHRTSQCGIRYCHMDR